jgi:battenin
LKKKNYRRKKSMQRFKNYFDFCRSSFFRVRQLVWDWAMPASATYTPIDAEVDAVAAAAATTTTDELVNNHTEGVADEEVDDHHGVFSSSTAPPSTWKMGFAFWFLGLLNNSSYVIMIASAKTISEGGTALVFLANILPSMMIKLTAPYWFDYVSYQTRMTVAFSLMVLSFGLVASLSSGPTAATAAGTASSSSLSSNTLLQLLGVAMGSAQTGIGEASLLAAAGKCDASFHNNGHSEGVCITAFSSGTGLAGVFGFLWKFLLNEWMRFSMALTLWLAQSLAVAYILIFWYYLNHHLEVPLIPTFVTAADSSEESQPLELTTYNDNNSSGASEMGNHPTNDNPKSFSDNPDIPWADEEGRQEEANHNMNNMLMPAQINIRNNQHKKPVHEMTVLERATFVSTLWPYIIPLFVVYAAEYSLQAGTWTAIGFPVSSERARDDFYEYSNWMVRTVFIRHWAFHA